MADNAAGLSRQDSLLQRPWRGNEMAGLVRPQSKENLGSPGGTRPTLFRGIPEDEYGRISGSARARDFGRGEMLCIEGESVRQVQLIVSGVAKITQLGSKGAEVILRLGTPGDLIGTVGLFAVGKHPTTAQAFHECRVLGWELAAFRSLVERFPVLDRNMAAILGAQLLELEERFREVATERVEPRLARQLVRLQGAIGRPMACGGFDICLSREDLADMTGTTLFTVSRLISAWAALGIVKARREAVTICDLQALRQISEGA